MRFSGKTQTRSLKLSFFLFFTILILTFFNGCSESLEDRGLRIGWAIEDITPQLPIPLRGQYYERISKEVQSPLKVTACAIESVDENGNKEQAIMVSMDVVVIFRAIQDSLRNLVQAQIPDFDVRKLFLNATHVHSAPDPKPGSVFAKLVMEKVGKAVVEAWKNRKPAGISRGLGYAVVGHNRRIQYANGTAEMYGSTRREDFIGLEGPSDPGVEMLFCWDLNKQLTGIIMNVSCPAQVMEAKYFISSDYWGEVRKQLQKKYSRDIYVLGQCSAAGDISPRDLTRGERVGEPNMWDISGIVEIGKRLVQAVDAVYPDAMNSIQTKPVFKHTVKEIELPTRKVTEEQYAKALAIVNEIRSREPKDINSDSTAWNRFLKVVKENEKTKTYGPWDNKESDFGILKINEVLLENYANQDRVPYCKVEVHVIRLGEVALVSNPFELYVDYGLRIKGRSNAKQTFIIQLSCDHCGYLPTLRATQGGGYSALVTLRLRPVLKTTQGEYSASVSQVGTEGGQILVDESVKMINNMFIGAN